MHLLRKQGERPKMNLTNGKLKVKLVKRQSSQLRGQHLDSDFELLIAKQEKRLRNFIVKHFRDENAIEDVFQQTLIEAYCCWDAFRGDAKRETWLFGIALNIIRNVSRRSPQYNYNFTTDESLEQEHAEDADPYDQVMKSQLSFKLESAISKLPEGLRETLVMVVQNGNTYQEAADMLGIPIGTVRSRISRSRAQLKSVYDLFMS